VTGVFKSPAGQRSAESTFRHSGVNISWNVNQHYREREEKERRDVPGRSVALICPSSCRLCNSARGVSGSAYMVVLLHLPLASPCTTRSELSGVARAQARTKNIRSLAVMRGVRKFWPTPRDHTRVFSAETRAIEWQLPHHELITLPRLGTLLS